MPRSGFTTGAKYLIIGAGMAADAAVHGIREVDLDGSIILVGAEQDPPYNRPLLSKGLWVGRPLEDVWSNTKSMGVQIILGRRITTLDLDAHLASDDSGNTYQFSKLLLATGSTPRDTGLGDHQVINFRSLSDYRRLRSIAEQAGKIAVIGGGFIGSELAASLTTNGNAVTMIFPEETISSRVLPTDLGRHMTAYYREKGVTVLSGSMATGLDDKNGVLSLLVRNQQSGEGQVVTVDGVVAGIGALPNLDLARAAGLEVDDGVLVDKYLQTSHRDVYAAGDIASVQQLALGGRRRVEHEDAANRMGKAAGRNMAGEPTPYDYLPLFYSDLFDMGYEAVGDVDSRLETVTDWAEPNRKGVIYYLKGSRIRGVLLWNVWGQVDAARKLITAGKQVNASDLRGGIQVHS